MNIKIKTFNEPQEYGKILAQMESVVEDIIAGKAEEQIWFLEHEDVYTAGTSAVDSDIVEKKFPIFNVGRGGKHTYHGPGQRVIYLMLDLKKHYKTPDLKKFVHDLEQWVIDSLAEIGVEAYRKQGMIGIWVKQVKGERLKVTEENLEESNEETLSPITYHLSPNFNEVKIAAIGIRVRKWVSFHGISININPNLKNFNGIVPCGIAEFGVTSLEKLGKKTSMEEFDRVMLENSPFKKS